MLTYNHEINSCVFIGAGAIFPLCFVKTKFILLVINVDGIYHFCESDTVLYL